MPFSVQVLRTTLLTSPQEDAYTCTLLYMYVHAHTATEIEWWSSPTHKHVLQLTNNLSAQVTLDHNQRKNLAHAYTSVTIQSTPHHHRHLMKFYNVPFIHVHSREAKRTVLYCAAKIVSPCPAPSLPLPWGPLLAFQCWMLNAEKQQQKKDPASDFTWLYIMIS